MDLKDSGEREATYGYAAGIIDGEGCITIGRWKDTRYATEGRFKYSLRIQVAMTDPAAGEFLYKEFGGLFRIYKGSKATRRVVYTWVLSTQKAADFLRLIRPYLRVKIKQAEVAIQYAEWTAAQSRPGSRGYDPSGSVVREEAYWELRKLKIA